MEVGKSHRFRVLKVMSLLLWSGERLNGAGGGDADVMGKIGR